MTRNDSHHALIELDIKIADLVAKLGVRRTAIALLRGLLAARPRPPDIANSLSAHVKRDIGLPPDAHADAHARHRDHRL